MLQPQHITEYFIKNYIKPSDIVIDATAGGGNDTLKLCEAVGKDGKVYAFDIQTEALEATQNKLSENGYTNAELILGSHSDMDKYITQKVRAVIFNLGYLPGGDHSICTHGDTSIKAIEKALNLLDEGGFVSVSVYHGKNTGTEEKEAVMRYLKTIDYKAFTVTVHDFFNRPNNPPLTAVITPN